MNAQTESVVEIPEEMQENESASQTMEAQEAPKSEAPRSSDGSEEAVAQPETEQASAEEAESSEEDVVAKLVAELAEARREADEARDRALRAQAELQNFRRRKERETEERVAHANARILSEILQIVDDFERAFDNVPADLQGEEAAWVEGFRLILRKLQTLLEREGVTAIDATGEFDPNLHEAVSLEPSDEVESGNIIGEVRRGYLLRDRVLRPSIVRVAQ